MVHATHLLVLRLLFSLRLSRMHLRVVGGGPALLLAGGCSVERCEAWPGICFGLAMPCLSGDRCDSLTSCQIDTCGSGVGGVLSRTQTVPGSNISHSPSTCVWLYLVLFDASLVVLHWLLVERCARVTHAVPLLRALTYTGGFFRSTCFGRKCLPASAVMRHRSCSSFWKRCSDPAQRNSELPGLV